MGNYVRNMGKSQRHPRCRSRARGSIRAAAVSHRPHDSHDCHDSARLPINVARNSHVNFLNFEIGSLIFRGFQGVIQETRWGITCDIYRDPSTGSAGSMVSTVSTGSMRSGHAVADWASGMRQTADPLGQKRRKSPISSQWVCTLTRFPLGTMLTSTRLPPSPR